MSTDLQRRRRSDLPEFIQTELDVDALASEMFARYAGEQAIVVEGVTYTTTFFNPDYCPDFRVMKLAGTLALRVNQRAVERPDTVQAMRVTVPEIMLAALLHDLGKQHEDCAPFLQLLEQTDLRGATTAEATARKQYLLGIVRDVHCRKGPCVIDRLADAGRPELSNPFVVTVARRHGDDYEVNRCTKQGCWWAREINVVTLADDYDAFTSEGPERAYKPDRLSNEDALDLIRKGVARGRYEPTLAQIFIDDVIGGRESFKGDTHSA